MKPLPLPFQDQRLLEAAEGWLGLGDWREANEELERIEAKFRVHPSVLELRYKIYAMAERWEMALEVARGVREMLPDYPWGHFNLARAHYYLKQVEDAYIL